MPKENSVLMSIRTGYCVDIASGKKTLEIRKNMPLLKTPFKVYIYCTSVKYLSIKDYVSLHQATGGRIDDWSGKVFSSFTCYHISEHWGGDYESLSKFGAITAERLGAYARGNTLYAWHIVNVNVFDNPLPLDRFWCRGFLQRPPQSWCYVDDWVLTLKDVMQGFFCCSMLVSSSLNVTLSISLTAN